MPHFHIEGVDRQTGSPVTEIIEAPSKDKAVQQVEFLVSKVRKASDPVGPLPPPQPYEGLAFAGTTLRVFGCVGIVIGVLLLLGGTIALLEGHAGPTALSLGVSTLIGSVLVFGVGEGLRALRDIAIAVTTRQ